MDWENNPAKQLISPHPQNIATGFPAPQPLSQDGSSKTRNLTSFSDVCRNYQAIGAISCHSQ